MSVREGVYEVLVRLAEDRGASISDVIAELINCCLNRAMDLSEVEELLRRCIDNLGGQLTTQVSPQLVNTRKVSNKFEEVDEGSLVGFEDNPWVQIIRARVVGGEGGEGR